MKTTGRFQVFLALFMMFSMVQSSFAQTMEPAQPSMGSATISLVDEYGASVQNGCFQITVSDGRIYDGCDNSGAVDGNVELENIPVGSMTVVQTSGPEGYTLSDPVTVTINADSHLSIPMTAYTILPDPVAANQPAMNEPVPAETSTETPVPTETIAVTETVEATETVIPTETAEPTETVAATETTTPTETTEVTETVEATETTTPTIEVTQTVVATEATTPTETTEATVPSQTVEATETVEATATTEPTATIEPTEVVEDDNKTGETQTQSRSVGPLALPGATANASCRYVGDAGGYVFTLNASPLVPAPVVTLRGLEANGTWTTIPVTDFDGSYTQPAAPYIMFAWEVTWSDGSTQLERFTGDSACSTTPQVQPELVTTITNADGVNLHDTQIMPDDGAFWDTAVLNNATSDATGEVTYYLYKGTTCGTSAPVFTSGPHTVVGGEVPDSAIPTMSAPGAYTWQAVYTGDRYNLSATSACGTEEFFYGQVDPQVTTTMYRADNSVIQQNDILPLGTTVKDGTEITGLEAGFPANGTVTYELYAYDGQTCTGENLLSGSQWTVPVTNGVVPTSPEYTPSEKGQYAWVVTFNSDTPQYTDGQSGCGAEVFEVGDVLPTVTTHMFDPATETEVPDGGVVLIGSQMFDTSVISVPDGQDPLALAPGTITYELYFAGDGQMEACNASTRVGDPVTLPITVVDGVVNIPDSPVVTLDQQGTYNWVVRYTSENDTYMDAISPCGSEVVNTELRDTETTTAPYVTSPENLIDNNAVISIDPVEGLAVGDTAVVGGPEVLQPMEGTVTFRLFAGFTCTGTPIETITVDVQPDGTVVMPTPVDIPGAGTYNWQATYNGDGFHSSSVSNCGFEQFHVTATGVGDGYVATMVRANGQDVPDEGTIERQTPMHDTASLYGSIENADGVLIFDLYYSASETDCSNPDHRVTSYSSEVQVVDGVPVSGSAEYVPQSAGKYEWVVTFVEHDEEGQPTGRTFTSPCGTETVNVSGASTETTTTPYQVPEGTGPIGVVLPDNESIVIGTPIYDTATVTGFDPDNMPAAPMVTFRLYKSAGCEADLIWSNTVELIDGVANSGVVPSEIVSSVGVYNWQAEYVGDEFNQASLSPCGSETFFVATQPTISTTPRMMVPSDLGGYIHSDVVPPDNSVNVSTLVYDTAALSDYSPGAAGSVTYTLYYQPPTDSPLACNASGVRVFTTFTVSVSNGQVPSSPPYRANFPGVYDWVAVYSGDVGVSTNGTLGTTRGVAGECGDERFVVPVDTAPGILTAMEYQEQGGSWEELAHNQVVPTGIRVRDEAVLYNVTPDQTGTVTYALHKGATCNQPAIWSSGPLPFDMSSGDGLLPKSDQSGVPMPTISSGTYNWVVTISFDGPAEDLVSPCQSETFRAQLVTPYLAFLDCSVVRDGSGQEITSYKIEVEKINDSAPDYDEPRPADGYRGLVVEVTPYNKYYEVQPKQTFHHYDSANYPEVAGENPIVNTQYRRLQVKVTWPNGRVFDGNVSCMSPQSVDVTTSMHASAVTEDPMPNGSIVPIDTAVWDSAVLDESTINAVGTVTYELYWAPLEADPLQCETLELTLVPGSTTTRTVSGGVVADSNQVTVENAGHYFWVVSYSGDTENNYPDVSPCIDEWFTVEKAEPTIATVMKRANGNTITPGSDVPVENAVYDTATFTGLSRNATGTVTYELHFGDPAICDETTLVSTYSSIKNVSNRTVPDSDRFTTTELGTYSWRVVYAGDANNEGVTSPCVDEQFESTPRTPTVVTTMRRSNAQGGTTGSVIANNATVPVNTWVIDTAVLNGATSTVSGEVTYELFENGTCAGTPVQTWTVTIGANGSIPPSGPFYTGKIGTYSWRVTYAGDELNLGGAENANAISGCDKEFFQSGKRTPTITTTMYYSDASGNRVARINNNASNVPIDSLVIDSAVITGNADVISGSVRYDFYTGAACNSTGSARTLIASQVVPVSQNGAGAASVPDFSQAMVVDNAGVYFWVVTYLPGGDPLHNTATSPGTSECFRVPKSSPTITTTMFFASDEGRGELIPNGVTNVPVDSDVMDTAVIDGLYRRATGTVTYELYLGGTCSNGNLTGGRLIASQQVTLGEGGSVPDFSDIAVTYEAGTYHWIVSYSGDANNNSARSGCGIETFSVPKAQPEFTTGMVNVDTDTGYGNDTSIPIDTTVADTSAFTEGSVVSENIGGEVTYTLYFTADMGVLESLRADACAVPTGTVVHTGTGAVTASGIADISANFTVANAGVYWWEVSYPGDANNEAYTSDGCDEWFYVEKAQPEFTTGMVNVDTDSGYGNDTSIPIDTEVMDTATFTADTNSDNISGEVTYTLYFTADMSVLDSLRAEACDVPTGAVVHTGTGAISAQTIADISANFTVANAGVYWWEVSYPGDANNAAYTSDGCEEWFYVEKAQPEFTTGMVNVDTESSYDNDTSIAIDTAVADTAAFTDGSVVSENIGGDVTYTLYFTADMTVLESLRADACAVPTGTVVHTGTGAVTASGIADISANFTVANAGVYWWEVSYPGDANNEAYTSDGCEEWFYVEKAQPEFTTGMVNVDTESGYDNDTSIAIDTTVADTASYTDNSVVSENIGGDVTYTLYFTADMSVLESLRAESCAVPTGTQVHSGTGAVTASGIADISANFTLANAGVYWWEVSYPGDANNEAYTSDGCEEWFYVEKAQPEFTTGMLNLDTETGYEIDTSIPIDTTVSDSATFTADTNSDNISGDVTYTLYFTADMSVLDQLRAEACTVPTGMVVQTGTGEIAEQTIGDSSEVYQVVNAGVYWWEVSYPGDPNNEAYTSDGCEEWFYVEKAQPEFTTGMVNVDTETGYENDTSIAIDTTVADTATYTENSVVSENIDGEVTYTLYFTADMSALDQLRGEICAVPEGTEVHSGTGAVTASGIADISENFTVANAGVYWWVVNYPESDNNLGYTSDGCEEWFYVEKAQPSITTEMFHAGEVEGERGEIIGHETVIPIDSVVIDTAVLTGASENATGTVTYTLIRAESCEVTEPEVIVERTVQVTAGDIPDFPQEPVTIDRVGTYYWIVSYSGDANNVGYPENANALSDCGQETFVVEKAVPALTTVMFHDSRPETELAIIENAEIIPIDSVVFDTATISGQSNNAIGAVNYQLFRNGVCGEDGVLTDGELIGEWEVQLGAGLIPDVPDATVIDLVGTYTWIVTYVGDDNNQAAVSGCGLETFIVDQAEPVITTEMFHATEEGGRGEVITNESTIAIDSVVMDTATFSGLSNNATGLVTYQLFHGGVCEEGVFTGGTLLGSWEYELIDGAVADVAPGIKIENVGSYTWIVSYSGDANNTEAVSGCGLETFVVDPAQPELVTEMYFEAEAGGRGEVIANESTITIDSMVLDTATMSGLSDNATGAVTYELFVDGVCEEGAFSEGTRVGTWEVALADGLVPDVAPGIKIENVGSYTWIVTYSGDANNAEAVSGCGLETFDVDPAQPEIVTEMYAEDGSIIANGAMMEQGTTLRDTAIISGQSDNATGTVTYQFFSDAACTVPMGDPTVVALENGSIPASGFVTVSDAGTYSWVVTYSGDANNVAAESGCGAEFFHVDTVTPAVVTTMRYERGRLIENNDVVITGNSVLDTAELLGATENAGGTATYQLFSDATCSVPVTEPQIVSVTNGEIPDSAVFTVTQPGTYYWVVTYSGDANNLAAISDCGDEYFRAELPPVVPTAPVDPATPVASVTPGTDTSTPPVPEVSELPETGSGNGGSWLIASLAGLLAAAFVASSLRLTARRR